MRLFELYRKETFFFLLRGKQFVKVRIKGPNSYGPKFKRGLERNKQGFTQPFQLFKRHISQAVPERRLFGVLHPKINFACTTFITRNSIFNFQFTR